MEEEWSVGGVEGKRCGCCQSFYLYEKAAAAKKKKKMSPADEVDEEAHTHKHHSHTLQDTCHFKEIYHHR